MKKPAKKMTAWTEQRPSSSRAGKWHVILAVLATGILLTAILAPHSIYAAEAKDGDKSAKAVALEKGSWRFIVSGDSRNCGDVVVPTIAADSAERYQPSFYWHMGDLRAIYKIDEDMAAEAQKKSEPLSCETYLKRAWPDFIEHQIVPFGPTRFYLGIGNHEIIPPRTAAEFSVEFEDWLLTPRRQMANPEKMEIATAKSGPCQAIAAAPYVTRKTYYHWIQGGVDFIYLDNSPGYFSPEQVAWFDCIVDRVTTVERNNTAIRSVVVGMHEVLPYSKANNHSMCDDPKMQSPGCESGKHVYEALVQLKKKKKVYVLASHSHFYLRDVFDREPANHRLDGWIVGTAGAVRYSLPPGVDPGPNARMDTYGYLVGTVKPDGEIDFQFQEVQENDVPDEVRRRYPEAFPHWCFAHNSQHKDPFLETTNRCSPPAEDSR